MAVRDLLSSSGAICLEASFCAEIFMVDALKKK
jgi:hypothetical protein